MTQSTDDGGSGAILIQTISDGKQANILQATDGSLNERLEDVIRVRYENEVEPEENDDDEPEICECCGQIIK